ncbi:MAG: sensor histidine kinase KdpD [Akkermansia sp.]
MYDLKSTPDEILEMIKKNELKQGRGRLKIFFGMAPGVGKTYAMLEAAQQASLKGIQVIIGVVETHGREDTAKLVESLPLLALKTVTYRGTSVQEFDLEKALQLNPQLILIDELAHTNAPGSRHDKRYQDVEELLVAGIDVYTTINVQHLESRADSVRDITGITIRETVPDLILTNADSIQLVDITPEQLITRLQEGKVYIPQQAKSALNHFFKETNLTALRELSLRLTAERVDHDLSSIRTSSGINSIWRSGERLMVAVGSSPFSTRLIRWTRRMAYALDAPWIAVSIDTGIPLSMDDRSRLDSNLELARGLGAEVIIVPGTNIADTLLRMAHLRNVSQIVIGKPRQTYFWGMIHPVSLVDKLVKGSDQIDIYVVPAEPRTKSSKWNKWKQNQPSILRECGIATATVCAVTLLGMLVSLFTGYFALGFLYLVGVVALGFFTSSRIAVILSASLSALLWNLIFIPPLMTFKIERPEDALMCFFFFVVALTTGRLTSNLKTKERSERQREDRTNALFLFTRAIASAPDTKTVIRNAIHQVYQLFGAKLSIFTVDPANNTLILQHGAVSYPVTDKERSVAEWSYKNGKAAGRFTNTLPGAHAFYLPMLSGAYCCGVIGIQVDESESLHLGQRDLLESVATQLAMVLEREQLRGIQSRALVIEESEKLHRSLLDSISHEFKTPLAVIEGVSEQLAKTEKSNAYLSESDKQQLYSEITTASKRLRRLVKNLLDVTRIESGTLRPKMDWCDLREVVECAMEATIQARKNHPTTINIPEDYPLVQGDFSLLEQILVNLLMNAGIHTSPETSICIEGSFNEQKKLIYLDVKNEGASISPEQAQHIFTRFQSNRPGGMGLGLSIVKGFIEVQNGHIELLAPSQDYTCFRLSLPWLPLRPLTHAH